jgi:D-alanyl-D-alanine carboxypeptidase
MNSVSQFQTQRRYVASNPSGGVGIIKPRRMQMQGFRIFRRWNAALLAGAIIASNHAASAQPGTAVPAQEAAAQLRQALVDEMAGSPSLPGELLHVHAPAQGLDVTLAVGVFDRESGRPLEPHHGFRVASVTKTFVAAAILRLHEQGRIGLDDPIARYLSAEYTDVLRGDGYAVDSITVRHILTHTSGINDYAADERYYAAVLGNPTHRWTRMEQVRAAMEWGQPRFAPGAGYHYSDTGYILLGAMLERLTRQPLAQALRAVLSYERLGLDETYLESLEPPPAGAAELSHPYFGEQDGFGIDASVDLYGGGGLVSSAEDLARFYRALLRGQVFERPATLQTMLTVPPTNAGRPGGAYAMGVQRRVIGAEECWGHTGFWGTAVYHCAGPDVTIVRHINQAQPDEAFLTRRVFDRVAEVLGMNR